MVTTRLVPIVEAQALRRPKAIGRRRQRMNEFAEYIQPLLDSNDQALIFDLEPSEDVQRFVLGLRQAFKRAGVAVTVRKMRARNEVRAWLRDANEPQRVRKPRIVRELVPA